jgi:hypothetical protein
MAENWQTLPETAILSANHRLWVPMHMEALVFAAEGNTSFLDLTPRYGNLSDQDEVPLGRRLRPQLDAAESSPDFLPVGIHVHWSLPAAFSHLRPTPRGDEETSTAPRVPNRWLVVRVWESPLGVARQKSWVVESDYRADDGRSSWIVKEDGAFLVSRLGRSCPLEDWHEQQTGAPLLTAFAPGNLGFAAFYPSCRDVFGFHDDATDLAPDAVCTYVVAGWFSDSRTDPLCVGTKDQWLTRMQEMGWAVHDTRFLPTQTTCYAAICGVKWTPDSPCDEGSNPDIEVALGNSILEAVAALAKGAVTDPDRLLSELQFAALCARRPTRRDLGDAGFFKDLGRFLEPKARLHAGTFAAQPGGTSWAIRQRDSRSLGEADAQPLVPFSATISNLLRNLNDCQHQCDERRHELTSARRQLFAAWYQRQYRTTRPMMDPADRERVDAALGPRVESCKARVLSLEGEVNNLAGQLESIRGTLETSLRQELPTCALMTEAMPRFWRSNDPFILLAPVPSPAIQGGRQPLVCRTSHQTVVRLVLDSGESGRQIKRDDLRQMVQATLPVVPEGVPDVVDLLLDVMLADWNRAHLLARVYWQPRNRNPSDDQLKEVASAIDKTQAQIEAAMVRIAQGNLDIELKELVVESVAMQPVVSFLSACHTARSKAPAELAYMSRPVFLIWKVKWFPCVWGPEVATAGNPSATRQEPGETWALNPDGFDYIWRGNDPLEGCEPCTYDGYTVIATNLDRGLGLVQQRFLDTSRTSQLAGQSLVGLTDAMGMLDTSLQLPPLKWSVKLQADEDVGILVGREYVAAPLIDSFPERERFFPIRSGHLSLTRLWLVDTFGRIRRVIEKEDEEHLADPSVHLGRSLKSSFASLAHLSPRLVQPARILLRWVSAEDNRQESLTDLHTSPICGWVVHNRLDRSLLVYAGDGSILGAVQAVSYPDGREAVRWSTMPLRPLAGAAAEGASVGADIRNPHLRGFVNGLIWLTPGHQPGTAYREFRGLLDRLEDAADLSLDHGLQPVLIGRPLALVRASLRLELSGSPLTDQGAQSLLRGEPGGVLPFLETSFSVRLGDRRLGGDGLIGYFVDDGTEATYGTLRLSGEQKPGANTAAQVYLNAGSIIKLACAPDRSAVMLTLLLDPKAGVHVVSGILPTNQVSLPPSLVSAAISDLEVPFLVAPALGERLAVVEAKAAPGMPLPTSGHGEWRWVFFPDHKSPAQELPIMPEVRAASSLAAPMALYEGWLKYRPSKGKNR